MENLPIKPKVALPVLSLAALREKAKHRTQPERDSLTAFEHKGLGGSLYVGPMSCKGYEAVENPETFGLPGTPVAGKKISTNAEDELNRDLAYLMHGVWAEGADGLQHLSREDAVFLFEGEGFGPSTRALIQHVKNLNPPREELTPRMEGVIASTSIASLVLRTLLDVGWGDAVIHYLAPSSTPEQKAWAEERMAQVQEVVFELGDILGTQDVMDRFGFRPKPESPEESDGED
ncbi:hypothetical protein EON83_12590 [bacterium]|nr:MAG: hypothetical protein EON83_12590 [bacterium]